MDPRQWTFELPFARTLLQRASPGFMVSIFSLVNVINFMDRGIVPGSFDSLGAFIRADLGVTSTDFYIGVLQSVYIVGFALACVGFGHAAHFFDSFKLMCLGLSIWVGAMLLSAWAPSYWVLVVARVLSGAGEGSFQTVVPPYIDDRAPPSKRGLWLALFFCGIPVGTALGNVYGGYISAALSWRWAFFFVGVAMVPFIVLIWHAPSPWRAAGAAPRSAADFSNNALASAALTVGEKKLAKVLSAGRSAPLPLPLALPASPQQRQLIAQALREDGYAAPGQALDFLRGEEEGFGASEAGAGTGALASPARLPPQQQQQQQQSTGELAAGSYALMEDQGAPGGGEGGASASGGGALFLRELLGLLSDPLFLSIALGYSGFAAVLAGLASFGPAICLGLGLAADQKEAALLFGVSVSIAGIIGTPLGGVLLDVYTRRLKRRIIETDPLLTAQLGLLAIGAQSGVSLGGSPLVAAVPSRAQQQQQLHFVPPSLASASRGDAADAAALEMQSIPVATSPRARRASASAPSATSAAGASTPPALPRSSAGAGGEEHSPGGTSHLPQPPPMDSSNPFETDIKLSVALSQASFLTLAGASICACGVAFGGSSQVLYFSALTLGAIALCCTTAGVNQSIMGSVRPESRPFAVGIATLITHLFGDVPAPVVIGALADALSPPSCLTLRPSAPTGNSTLGDDPSSPCVLIRDPGGLKATLLITTMWLLWPIVLWAVAWCISEGRGTARRREALQAASAVLDKTQAQGLFARLMGRGAALETLRDGVLSVIAGVALVGERLGTGVRGVFRGRGSTGFSQEGEGEADGRGSLLAHGGGLLGGEEDAGDTEEDRKKAQAFVDNIN